MISSIQTGSYILLLELDRESQISFGRHKSYNFMPLHYAYVGSAMSGIRARVGRHMSRRKKIHWNIDHLLQEARLSGVIICQSERRLECQIAEALARKFDSVPGFGNSDCRCHSHLFMSHESMERRIYMILNWLKLDPEVVDLAGISDHLLKAG